MVKPVLESEIDLPGETLIRQAVMAPLQQSAADSKSHPSSKQLTPPSVERRKLIPSRQFMEAKQVQPSSQRNIMKELTADSQLEQQQQQEEQCKRGGRLLGMSNVEMNFGDKVCMLELQLAARGGRSNTKRGMLKQRALAEPVNNETLGQASHSLGFQ